MAIRKEERPEVRGGRPAMAASGRTDPTLGGSGAKTVLALQRLVGNRAVAGILAGEGARAGRTVQREIYLAGGDMSEGSLPDSEDFRGRAERAGPGVLARLAEMLTDGIKHDCADWPAAIAAAARLEGVKAPEFPPKRKWEEDESDSDSENEAVENATKRRRVLVPAGGIFNATKSEARSGNIKTKKERRQTLRTGPDRKRKVPRVKNWAEAAAEVTKEQLSADAKAIHTEALGPASPGYNKQTFGATTVVTAALLDIHGTVQKFMFTNLDKAVAPKLRAAAGKRGYQSIAAQQSHAEGELIQYVRVNRDGFYSIQAIGCDKDHCVECDEVLRKVIGSYQTALGVGTVPFANYYMPPPLVAAFGKAYTSRTDPTDAKAMLRHDAVAARKVRAEKSKARKKKAPKAVDSEEEGD